MISSQVLNGMPKQQQLKSKLARGRSDRRRPHKIKTGLGDKVLEKNLYLIVSEERRRNLANKFKEKAT
jgi:hypothetical protein